MTVVGLQNKLDGSVINLGDSGSGDKLSGLGSTEFLEIFSMLAVTGGAEISQVEETSLDDIPNTGIFEGYMTPTFVSQFTSIQPQKETTTNGMNVPISELSDAPIAPSSELFDVALTLEEREMLLSNKIDGKYVKTFDLSYYAAIQKIQIAIENLKTNLEQNRIYFDRSSEDQQIASVTHSSDENTTYSISNLMNQLFANSGELDKTLNLKVLDDPNTNTIVLTPAETFSGDNEYGSNPSIVKFFMRPETDFKDVSNANKVVKININLGPDYTDIQLVNNNGENEIENIRLLNSPDGTLGLEVDKSNIKALSVSILSKSLDGSNPSPSELASGAPNIVLTFNNLSSSGVLPEPSIKIQTTQEYLVQGENINPQTPMDKANLGQTEFAAKPSFELANLETINSDLKFSEIGAQDLSFDKKQITNVIENVINNLSLFKPKNLGVLVSNDIFSELIQKHRSSEQISRIASLLFTTELNFEQKSLKSSLLTSTANVLQYMNGIKNLSPKFVATNDYVISENGEFEHIGPFETISRKDKDLDKAVQSSVKIVDKEIVGAKGDQIRTQPAVLPAAVQNSGQPQITSTGGSINYVSNNTSLQVLDAQFNSRLGMLLTDKVALGQEKFELQLEPESFGKVRVSVSLDNSTLEVKMVAENTGAVSILRNAEALLQSITDQSGLKLSEYSVEMQNNSENKRNNSNNEGGNTNSSNENESKIEEMKANDLRLTQDNKDQVLNLLA